MVLVIYLNNLVEEMMRFVEKVKMIALNFTTLIRNK